MSPPVRDCCSTHHFGDTIEQRASLGLFSRMWLCSVCGNKRCPHATLCAFACTGSNDPGQPGSVYQ